MYLLKSSTLIFFKKRALNESLVVTDCCSSQLESKLSLFLSETVISGLKSAIVGRALKSTW